MVESLDISHRHAVQPLSLWEALTFQTSLHKMVSLFLFMLVSFIGGLVYLQYQIKLERLKQAENELRESKDRYRNLIENSPYPIIVHCDQRIVLANSQAIKTMAGQAREDFIGRSIWDFVHKNSLATVQDRVRKIYDNRSSVQILEEKFVRFDQTIIDVEVAASFVEYRGKPASQVIFRDISNQKKVELARMKSEALFRAITETAEDAIFCKDRELRYTLVNPSTERFFQSSARDIMGKTAADFLEPEITAEIHRCDHQVLMGEIVNLIRTFSFYGHRKTFHVIQVPLRDADNGVSGLCGIVRDITPQKEAEEALSQLNAELEQRVLQRTVQLENANKELQAFSYSVSHDLRAPLRAINGFAQIILEDYGEKLDEEGIRLLGVIRQNTKKMGDLINDLLVFSRLGQTELQFSPLDMNQIVRESFEEIVQYNPNRQIELQLSPLPMAYGDHAMIRQVFANLLSNAAKFTRPRKQAIIEVKGHQFGEEFVFSVHDNGVGFDRRFAARLFEVFERLHPPEEFEGTGIGLSLVRRIIHRHGGVVRGESELGQGATFFFTLPVQRDRNDISPEVTA
jgi:PAS domain S-box-containing protein